MGERSMSEFKERIEKLGAEISLGGMELRDEYQTEIHLDTIEHCRATNKPTFVEASVGAGKSLQIAFFADHVAKRNGKVLVLARQGELIEQNSNEGWAIGCKNSIYSASLKVKSLHYPVVFGTEGTVGRALHTHFKDWIPDCILIDECLTGDSMITTKDGDLRIDDPELVNKEIKCIDEKTGKIYFDKPVKVLSNGMRNVSLYRTRGGRVLSCTKNHRIFTTNSWVYARDIQVGQKIRLEDSQSFVMTRCLRALVAVAKKLASLLVQKALNV